MVNATILVEGGAMRGVFSSGVLDFLMEKDFYTSSAIGISAGACNAIDYASKQIGRSRDCFIITNHKDNYIQLRNFLKRKSIMNMEKIFVDFPQNQFPFDAETFSKNDMKTEIVVTNCITGKAEFITLDKKEALNSLNICRASCSMPRFMEPVVINGIPYVDGGAADALPIQHALDGQKNGKVIVISTRAFGFRLKEHNASLRKLLKIDFRKYPNLYKSLDNRPRFYNSEMELMEKLEREGKIFVIRPEGEILKTMDSNIERLTDFYNQGRQVMKRRYSKLQDYLCV